MATVHETCSSHYQVYLIGVKSSTVDETVASAWRAL